MNTKETSITGTTAELPVCAIENPDAAAQMPASTIEHLSPAPGVLTSETYLKSEIPGTHTPEPASSSQQPAAAIQDPADDDDSITPPIVPLAGLEPLQNEDAAKYRAFMLFLASQPISFRQFASQKGYERTTLHRWKKRFRWEDRIRHFNAAQLAPRITKLQPAPEPHTTIAPDESRALQCNFRAKALSIALSALDRWQSSDESPVTLPGIVRLLELALKITGQNAISTSTDIEGHSGFDQLMKAMEKVYGADAMAAANAKPVQP